MDTPTAPNSARQHTIPFPRPAGRRAPGRASTASEPRTPLLGLRARIQAGRLDRRLSEEVDPASSPLLLERSHQLLSGRLRRSLARGFELALAESDGSARRAGIPVNRDAVSAAAPVLETLIARLRDGEAVSPQGVAMAKAILCDGSGPLYGGRSRDTLLASATAARSALERGPRP